jgi:hypothetical protein
VPDSASRIVVEAHTLRSQTAKAALLHGSQRTPRELRRPYAGIIGSLVVGIVLVVVVWAATKIGNLIEEQRERRRATTAAAEVLLTGSSNVP